MTTVKMKDKPLAQLKKDLIASRQRDRDRGVDKSNATTAIENELRRRGLIPWLLT